MINPNALIKLNEVIRGARNQVSHSVDLVTTNSSSPSIIKEIVNTTITKRFSVSIYLDSWMFWYYGGTSYIIKNSKDIFHSEKVWLEFKSMRTKDNYTELRLPELDHCILMKDGRTVCYLTKHEIADVRSDNKRNLYKIKFIGKSSYKYMHELIALIRKGFCKREFRSTFKAGGNYTVLNSVANYESNIRYKLCDFDNVVLKDKDDVLIKPLEELLRASSLYKKYNVVYKFGILLYGVPGSGKSTVIRAIINKIGNATGDRTFLMDLNQEPEKLLEYIRSIKVQTSGMSDIIMNVIILEEIDSVFPRNRDNINQTQLEKISILLQFIDGPLSPENTVFIATTNYIDRLDEALIRDGRFNIKINMGLFGKDEASEMCKMYNVSLSDVMDMGEEDTIVPATLQKIIFNYILSTNMAIDKI